jgi:hypothetical protein
VLACTNEKFIDEIGLKIGSSFNMVNLGDIRQFLGMEITRDSNGDYFINQNC